MATGEVTSPLLTAFQRLIDLLNEPKDIPILAPVINQRADPTRRMPGSSIRSKAVERKGRDASTSHGESRIREERIVPSPSHFTQARESG